MRFELAQWFHNARNVRLAYFFLVLGVVLIAYYPSLKVGFFWDDWVLLEWATRLSVPEFLKKFLDPRVQSVVYRPVRGIVFLLSNKLFGANPTGYHLLQILSHAANCLMLYLVVERLSGKRRVAFLSGLIFATQPFYNGAVFWVRDTMMVWSTFFHLASVWFWACFLQQKERRNQWFTYGALILGVLSKEMAITAPATLFLIDRLLVRDQVSLVSLIKRYLPIVFIMLPYLVLEYWIQKNNGIYVKEGYSLVGLHALVNLVDYLTVIVLPWNMNIPILGFPWKIDASECLWCYAWLITVVAIYAGLIVAKRSRALAFLGLEVVVTLSPLLGFTWRFPYASLNLYATGAVSSVIIGALFAQDWRRFNWPSWRGLFAPTILLLFVVINAFQIAEAAGGLAELARRRRVPFLDVVRQHPTLPDDTYLYFIDPPTPIPDLSGMFTLRYGPKITVWGSHLDFYIYEGGLLRAKPARLRDHNQAYVYYFDDTGAPREVPVDREIQTPSSTPPVKFAAPIQLEEYEVTTTRLQRGKALVVLLYWRVISGIEKDYQIFTQLVDQNRQVVSGHDGHPRNGFERMTWWRPGEFIVDGHVIEIPADLPVGARYMLNVGLYYLPTMERVGIIDQSRTIVSDAVIIEDFVVVQ